LIHLEWSTGLIVVIAWNVLIWEWLIVILSCLWNRLQNDHQNGNNFILLELLKIVLVIWSVNSEKIKFKIIQKGDQFEPFFLLLTQELRTKVSKMIKYDNIMCLLESNKLWVEKWECESNGNTLSGHLYFDCPVIITFISD